MSEFFEKISPYHFNNSEENINNYAITRVIDRFNKLFLHLENGDHYFEKYNIDTPVLFNFDKKYSLQIENNIHYVKLRLCDSNLWGNILSEIFNTEIITIIDYQTEKKSIGHLYKKFKEEYKLPINYFETIKNCKYLNYYYNEEEKKSYLKSWELKLGLYVVPYTEVEYAFYMNLCLENQYINDIQIEHYIDNGCFCKYCSNKRKEIFFKVKKGEKNIDKIVHVDVINEQKQIIHTKIKNVIKLNSHIMKNKNKNNSTQFKIKLNNK
jgi:hypothetical protein